MVTAVRAESEKLASLSKHLDAKRKNLADEMQREMSKRLKLEDNITRRLFSTGEYKLEGLRCEGCAKWSGVCATGAHGDE